MYAFCILNKKTGIEYLVRDRLGIKPIYYIKQGDFFAFSKEPDRKKRYRHRCKGEKLHTS